MTGNACAVAAAVATSALLLGCGGGADTERTEVRWLDRQTFEQQVQSTLGEHCGNPSCHGRPDRPLSIYSPLRWRADPSRTFIDEPLTIEEQDHNYVVSCVMATEGTTARETLLATKPLADLVGVFHGGGPVFSSRTDRDYRTLVSWVEVGW